MIWYVKRECLHELNVVARGDTRGLTQKMHELLEEEKAFTTTGYEQTLAPSTKKALDQLVKSGAFVEVPVQSHTER